MDNESTRHLFNSLREDIRELKRDVAVVIVRHERMIESQQTQIDELREFRWRTAGALAVVVLLFELGVQLIAHALK